MLINSVFSFNNEMQCLYQNPHPPPENGLVALIDASASMKEKQGEMKLVASALKCMTGTIGKWNLPEAVGGTALIDSVDKTIAKKLIGVNKVLIASDGDDTTSCATKLIKAFTADGTPELIDTPPYPLRRSEWLNKEPRETPQQYDNYRKECLDARRAAVATHLNKMGIDLFIIGVGDEVKKFITECAKPGFGIRTALIDMKSTAEQVGAVVKTVMKPRSANNNATVTASNATAITQQEASAITTEARRTSTANDRRNNQKILRDGEQFDHEAEQRYVAFIIENEAKKINVEVGIINMIVNFFRKNIYDGSVAGDLIGGRLYPPDKHGRRNGAIFDVPLDSVKASAWTNTLNRCLELLSRDPEWIYERVPGLQQAFGSEIASNIVGPLFCDVGKPASSLAITESQLPQLKGRVLYYKFKEDTYTHYVRHHRADSFVYNNGPSDNLNYSSLKVVWRGNSGRDSYGGPPVDAASTGKRVVNDLEDANEQSKGKLPKI